MDQDSATQREVHQRWLLEEFPSAGQLVPFVLAVAATAEVPMRRFSAWHDPTREVKGSWEKARDKLLTVLATGHRGGAIRVVGVYSYHHRGSNRNVGTQVWFTPHHDEVTGHLVVDRPVQLEVGCRVAEDTDAEALGRRWEEAARTHLAGVHRDADLRVEVTPVITSP